MALTLATLDTIEQAAIKELHGQSGPLTWAEIAHPKLLLQMVAQLRLDRKREVFGTETLLSTSLDATGLSVDHQWYTERNYQVDSIELSESTHDSVTFSFDENDRRYEVRYEYSPSEECWEPDQMYHLLDQDNDFDYNFDSELSFVCGALVARLRDVARELATPVLKDATTYLVTSINNQLHLQESLA